MEDISIGKSWLSFARGSSAIDYESGEYRKERKKFTGKTYDSVDSIAEFFKQRATQLGNTGGGFDSTRNASRSGRGTAPRIVPAMSGCPKHPQLRNSKRETRNSRPQARLPLHPLTLPLAPPLISCPALT